MTSPLDNGNRWIVAGVALFVTGLGALILDHAPALALVNESPSLPRGVYWRQPGGAPNRGAIVALPQPPGARAYLADLGMPSSVLLIKRVAAVGGEPVCATNGRVVVPGREVAVTTRDRRGAALPAWTGCRRLAADELFLLGDSALSFDSRNFGPIRRRTLVGVYREGVTW